VLRCLKSILNLFFFWYWTWTQDLHHEPLRQPFFVMGFVEIGLENYLPRAGLELQSSWSLPPE
jgi:hypothetical protein